MPRFLLAAFAAGLMIFGIEAKAEAGNLNPAKNVLLVHGAWADGSSWMEVIARLHSVGLNVISVQNPLTSLEDAVAETRRVLALQDGPTVLVGHSWAGTAISEVGVDSKVSALVYVAARAPDAGEDFVATSAKFPTMPVRAGVVKNNDLTVLSEDAYLTFFANGVPREKARVLYAVQQPTAAGIFSGRTTTAAWHTKPSYYAVAKDDLTISPDLQRFLAKRMNATTVEISGGHLIMISHAQEVANLIIKATGVTQ